MYVPRALVARSEFVDDRTGGIRETVASPDLLIGDKSYSDIDF